MVVVVTMIVAIRSTATVSRTWICCLLTGIMIVVVVMVATFASAVPTAECSYLSFYFLIGAIFAVVVITVAVVSVLKGHFAVKRCKKNGVYCFFSLIYHHSNYDMALILESKYINNGSNVRMFGKAKLAAGRLATTSR